MLSWKNKKNILVAPLRAVLAWHLNLFSMTRVNTKQYFGLRKFAEMFIICKEISSSLYTLSLQYLNISRYYVKEFYLSWFPLKSDLTFQFKNVPSE